MTIRIAILGLAVRVETHRIQHRRVHFGRPAPEPAISAAMLISAASVLTGVAQIAGVL